MAKHIGELPVYVRVLRFWVAVNALLDRPALRKDCKLHRQIADAADSIPSNMEEGFEQGTDRAFARYVTISKGSLAELLGHLQRAVLKRRLDAADTRDLLPEGEEIAKMLGGFIKYLQKSGFKNRGHHTSRSSTKENLPTEQPPPSD